MKQQFLEISYNKLKGVIENISETDASDIYALSFWYNNDNDDPRFPMITFSFNTTENYKENIKNASGEKEAKWNYAFWLQNDIVDIGGKNNELLNEWFKMTDYFYSDEDDRNASKDKLLFNEILNKGSQFNNEFIEEIIILTKRLFAEKVIKKKFGKDIPVLVHELEYYEEPIRWTIKSNPNGLVDEFVEWARTQ
ncbi:hypothetical protein VO54_03685 [Elizabethkingia miricola]|nr:hypothetical protein VO54_03685 [Elizabethkingia miricola]